MRKFAFQELAYAIVVASSYGLLLGLLYNTASDFWIFFVWILMMVGHLAGIVLIEYLENKKRDEKQIK
jgi:hypothetical protein